MPLFSIIIPTFGRPQLLSEAVQSVLAQTVDDFECLVVDDGSPTAVEVPDDPRVRVVRRRLNGGPSAARNTGMEEAQGQYVAFLDDDDVYTPDRLRLAVDGLERAPIAVCWAPHIGEGANGRLISGRVGDHVLSGTAPHLDATAVDLGIVQPFSEFYPACQDLEWWVRMAEHPIVTVPRVGAHVRRHDETRLGRGRRARIDGSMRLLQEHEEFFAARPPAAAFRWKRVGIMARQVGDPATARMAFRRSLRAQPDLKAGAHLLRAIVGR